jgi:hypothetical protein
MVDYGVPCDIGGIEDTQANSILVIRNVNVLLKTQDFGVANISTVDE